MLCIDLFRRSYTGFLSHFYAAVIFSSSPPPATAKLLITTFCAAALHLSTLRLHMISIMSVVLLSIENLKLPGVRSCKLTPRFCGPFTVLKTIGANAVKLDLHGQVSFHDVINVSRLKRFNVGDADRYPGRQLFMPPPPDVIDGEEHYTVQAFLDSRLTGKGRGKHLECLVRWEGYPPDFDEWITAANL